MARTETTPKTAEAIQSELVRAIPGLDINKIIESNPSVEHNAREELGAITRSIAEFMTKYH